jgi:hypothetical protein
LSTKIGEEELISYRCFECGEFQEIMVSPAKGLKRPRYCAYCGAASLTPAEQNFYF